MNRKKKETKRSRIEIYGDRDSLQIADVGVTYPELARSLDDLGRAACLLVLGYKDKVPMRDLVYAIQNVVEGYIVMAETTGWVGFDDGRKTRIPWSDLPRGRRRPRKTKGGGNHGRGGR